MLFVYTEANKACPTVTAPFIKGLLCSFLAMAE